MFERFTTKARSAVTRAQQEALGLGHPSVGTQHVLLAIASERDSAGARILGTLGVGVDDVREAVRTRAERDPAAFSEEDSEALRSVGIDLEEVRRSVEYAFGPGALDRPVSGARGIAKDRLPFTAGTKKALELSLREAIHLGNRSIGTEHLLLGLVRDQGCSAAGILRARGVDRERVRAEVLREIASGGDRPGRTA